jgi:hypothetical protein
MPSKLGDPHGLASGLTVKKHGGKHERSPQVPAKDTEWISPVFNEVISAK